MTNKCPGHHLGISGGGAGADPEHTGGDHVSLLPWEHLCPPLEELEEGLVIGKSGPLCFDCCLQNLDPLSIIKWMDAIYIIVKQGLGILKAMETVRNH